MHQWERSVEQKLKYCDSMRRAHSRARFIWGRTGSVLGATLTVSAALSGGTAIANIQAAAVALGVVTAVLGGLLSALSPHDRSAAHLLSASDFNRAFAATERLYLRGSTRGVSTAEFDELLSAIDDEIATAESRASPVQVRDDEAKESDARVTRLMAPPGETSQSG